MKNEMNNHMKNEMMKARKKNEALTFVLVRKLLERGSIMGTLSHDGEVVCDTLEREGGCLAPGEYRVEIGKCKLASRKMPLITVVGDVADASDAHCSVVPDASVCQRCHEERLRHEMGQLDEMQALPCAMMQPGNGVFNLRQGSILLGEAHAPGYMLRSQKLFLQFYDRIYTAIWRGKEVRLVIK